MKLAALSSLLFLSTAHAFLPPTPSKAAAQVASPRASAAVPSIALPSKTAMASAAAPAATTSFVGSKLVSGMSGCSVDCWIGRGGIGVDRQGSGGWE